MAIFAFEDPLYQPAMRIIANIVPTVFEQQTAVLVTTTFDHDYLDGLIVRLVIPDGFGMPQVDGLVSNIVINTPTQFYFFIPDYLSLDPFVQPLAPPYVAAQRAQIIPVGQISSLLVNATHNVLG